jgi:hypothetical protein
MPIKQSPSHPRCVRDSPGDPGLCSRRAVLRASIKAVTKGKEWLMSMGTDADTNEGA